MAIYSCYNGSHYELFSSKEAAESRAKSVLKDFQDQGHTIASAPLSQMVEEGPVAYWHRPPHTIEKTIANEVCTIHVGFQESKGCVAGDDSEEVATAVAEWWKSRDAVWNSVV